MLKQYTSSKDMNRTIADLVRKGWTVSHGKHVKLRSPEGKLFVASATPRCPHAYKNLLRDIEKYRKATG